MLCSAVDKAQEGKHQYLSGTLHNVAKALANAQPQPDMQEALLAAGYGSSELKAVIRRSCISASPAHLTIIIIIIIIIIIDNVVMGRESARPDKGPVSGVFRLYQCMMCCSLLTVHHVTFCAHDRTCHTRGFSE